MEQMNFIQTLAVWALPVLFAITVHEVAHGWVAQRLGDPTAMMLGRLTLNPVKHVDLLGTVIVPILLLYMGGFVFGWAKPVPVTWENLKQPKRDMVLVAAGPLATQIRAFLWAIVMKIGLMMATTYPDMQGFFLALFYMGGAGLTIHIVLMVLNLLPVPPLDGSRVVTGFLSDRAAWQYNRIEPYGLLVILVLLGTGALGYILVPPVQLLRTFMFTMFGL